jgi:hypothetical protein
VTRTEASELSERAEGAQGPVADARDQRGGGAKPGRKENRGGKAQKPGCCSCSEGDKKGKADG